jgi:16S rRNA (cytosine1407-C5)-methyltransferase
MKKILKNRELVGYLESLLKDEYNSFLASHAEPTAIRINKLKSSEKQFIKFLDSHQIKFKKIEFNPDGLILEEDPLPLSHTLPFFTGGFQYQGISSQLPVILLDPQPGDYILDIAAAPGSKAAQIAALMQNDGLLAMNDNSYQRLQALNTNIQKSGALNTFTLNYRGERMGKLMPEYFNKILVDSPCTALGTLHSSPEVAGWWSYTKLDKLAGIQNYLLISALKALKVGGTLVYSTCSVTPEENEVLIDKILKKYPVKIVSVKDDISSQFDPGIINYKNECLHKDLEFALRIWPHKHGMEGFFAVKLQKLDHIAEEPFREIKNYTILKSSHDPEIVPILEHISNLWGIPYNIWANYHYYTTKERIWMTSKSMDKIPVDKFVSAGMLLAENRLSGWKLVNGSVQVLASHINKRRISLSDRDVKKIFKTGELSGIKFDYGYYVLEFEKKPIASVYVENDKMRLRIPHRFNLRL